MYISVYLNVCLCAVCVCCLWRPDEGIRSPGLELEMLLHAKGVQGILNLGLLKEELVFVAAEPSLQP